MRRILKEEGKYDEAISHLNTVLSLIIRRDYTRARAQ